MTVGNEHDETEHCPLRSGYLERVLHKAHQDRVESAVTAAG